VWIPVLGNTAGIPKIVQIIEAKLDVISEKLIKRMFWYGINYDVIERMLTKLTITYEQVWSFVQPLLKACSIVVLGLNMYRICTI